jgi:hypothetical protein
LQAERPPDQDPDTTGSRDAERWLRRLGRLEPLGIARRLYR